MRYRSYTDWCHPKLDGYYWEVYDELPQIDGHFLVHVGGKGDPRCLCVKYTAASNSYLIHQDEATVELTGPVMRSLVNRCVDRNSIVFFSVSVEVPSLPFAGPALSKLFAQ